jgi:S-adenosylmethionine synthetase
VAIAETEGVAVGIEVDAVEAVIAIETVITTEIMITTGTVATTETVTTTEIVTMTIDEAGSSQKTRVRNRLSIRTHTLRGRKDRRMTRSTLR